MRMEQNELISSSFPSQFGDFYFAKKNDTYIVLLKTGTTPNNSEKDWVVAVRRLIQTF